MQQRGLSAYLAELIGTFLLVFFICSVVILFVATGSQPQFGSDFAVVGLVHAFLLFGLDRDVRRRQRRPFQPRRDACRGGDQTDLAGRRGDLHARPALRRRARRAARQGAAARRGTGHALRRRPGQRLLGGNFQGSIVEAVGTFCLVLVILAAVYSKKSVKDWAPLAIGTTLGFIVMVGGPLTGGSFNPARWFGPALVGNEWGGVWPYLVGPIVGSLLAAVVYKLVLEPGGPAPTEPPERVKAPPRRSPAPAPPPERRPPLAA